MRIAEENPKRRKPNFTPALLRDYHPAADTGADFWVAVTGDDANPGTGTAPFAKPEYISLACRWFMWLAALAFDKSTKA